jgi:hypothetical protein
MRELTSDEIHQASSGPTIPVARDAISIPLQSNPSPGELHPFVLFALAAYKTPKGL